MTVRELGLQLRSGRVSCAELVTQAIASAKQHEELRAFITLTEERALEEARERDRELRSGQDRGALHGIPIAYKDLFYTRGTATTAGSLLYRNFVPDTDADVVESLSRAGAVSIGKTNLHELAFGITSRNPHFGAVLNPVDKTRLPGGSSGGSAAAIRAGIVPVALGSDTGGSIRIPAAYCGLTGLKPTYGRVSRKGVLPLAFSLDHVGPLGTCAEDCALALNGMAEGEFNAPALADFKGVRVGIAQNFFFERLDQQVEAAVKRAIVQMQRAGATLVDVRVPDMVQASVAARIVQYAEFASLQVGQNDARLFGRDLWAHLEQGRAIAGHEYVNAQRMRTIFRTEMDALWREIDLLVTPTTPITAPKADQEKVWLGGVEETVRMATTRLVRPINYLGEPALSLPCGNDTDNMPIGLQLIAPPFAEGPMVAAAKTLERILQG